MPCYGLVWRAATRDADVDAGGRCPTWVAAAALLWIAEEPEGASGESRRALRRRVKSAGAGAQQRERGRLEIGRAHV